MKFLKWAALAVLWVQLVPTYALAEGSDKGNGQLLVQLVNSQTHQTEWVPIEVGVVYLSHEYYGVNDLRNKTAPGSSERQFLESFGDWLKLLQTYSPVESM